MESQSTKLKKHKTLFDEFTRSLRPLITKSKHKRHCHKLTDEEWVETGILRTIFQEPSGRGFLQTLPAMGRKLLKRTHFFETLNSGRRLRLCQDVNNLLLDQLSSSLSHADPLKEYPELAGFDPESVNKLQQKTHINLLNLLKFN